MKGYRERHGRRRYSGSFGRSRRNYGHRGHYRDSKYERRDNYRIRRTFRKERPLTKEDLDNDLDNYYQKDGGDKCKIFLIINFS